MVWQWHLGQRIADKTGASAAGSGTDGDAGTSASAGSDKDSSKGHPVANNMKEVFEKTPFGKKLKSVVQSTGKFSLKNELIYKVTADFGHSDIKKGDYIHFDKLHKCELEVYDKTGKSKSVVWLDGIVNQQKKSKIGKTRTIKV